MTCERCDGLMVSERIDDLQGLNSDLWANGYRCFLCGNVIGATILENRRQSTEAPTPLTVYSPRMARLVAA